MRGQLIKDLDGTNCLLLISQELPTSKGILFLCLPEHSRERLSQMKAR